MDISLPAELLCSFCDEMFKRGAQMKCCGTRACRACAVFKINKTRKCWNEECGEKHVSIRTHLNNDYLLRKAVEYFKKNGKMAPAHKKILNIRDGKPLEDVSNKFNKTCPFGDKCRRKTCLFVHDKATLGDGTKAHEAEESNPAENGKPCQFGAECMKKDACKSNHPDIKKPCSPFSEAKDRAMSALEEDRNQIGSDFGAVLLNGNPMNGEIGASIGGMEGLMSGGTKEMDGGMASSYGSARGYHSKSEIARKERSTYPDGSMKMSNVAVEGDSGTHNTSLVQKELEGMISNATWYGILPSYHRFLWVVNGINTAISNNN